VGEASDQPEVAPTEPPPPPTGPAKVDDHIGGVLAVAVGWGIALFGLLWWQLGFSWWYPLYALGFAVVHPVIGKLWYWIIDSLCVAAMKLWQKEPKFEFSGVVEEMYISLFWPVIVPLALPVLLVAISVGATFRPAKREVQGELNNGGDSHANP